MRTVIIPSEDHLRWVVQRVLFNFPSDRRSLGESLRQLLEFMPEWNEYPMTLMVAGKYEADTIRRLCNERSRHNTT